VAKQFSEEDKETIWTMREAGVPVKLIAKHLDRTLRCGGSLLTMEAPGQRLANVLSCGCRLWSEKRSPEGWPPDCRSEPSPQVWSGHRRRSAVR
jgi:hypothetical protein